MVITYADTSNTVIDAADGRSYMLKQGVHRVLDSYVDPDSLAMELWVDRHLLGLSSNTFCCLEIQVRDDYSSCVGSRNCYCGPSADTAA